MTPSTAGRDLDSVWRSLRETAVTHHGVGAMAENRPIHRMIMTRAAKLAS